MNSYFNYYYNWALIKRPQGYSTDGLYYLYPCHQGSATIASAYVEGESRDRGGNLGNTHTINWDNASVIQQENGNDWHRLSVRKLKHMATG
jgi:hypothetical protein